MGAGLGKRNMVDPEDQGRGREGSGGGPASAGEESEDSWHLSTCGLNQGFPSVRMS